MRRTIALALVVAGVAACRDGGTGPGPAPNYAVQLPPAGARGITVMTRNLYLGTELGPLFEAPTPQVPLIVAQLFGEIQASNFAERAQALADEIAGTQPHLVGLQEVELYRVQTPGDGPLTPATTVAIDFLQLLLDALAARDLHYRVITTATNVDAEAPALVGFDPTSGPLLMDVRLTDRDVILAREDVATSDAASGNYAARFSLPVGGLPLPIVRGWTSVVATVAGTEIRFVNTHLETQDAPPIQALQAQELLTGVLESETRPTILVGDFNSAANGSQTPTYGAIRGAGFADAWGQKHPDDPGYTCCEAANLLNPTPSLDQRLDIVFFRDGLGATSGRITGGVHVNIVGDDPVDRTPSGLWPSDHAGLVATLTVPPAVARR